MRKPSAPRSSQNRSTSCLAASTAAGEGSEDRVRRRCSPRCRSRSRPSATGRTATARVAATPSESSGSRPPSAQGRPAVYLRSWGIRNVPRHVYLPRTRGSPMLRGRWHCHPGSRGSQWQPPPRTTAADPQHDPGSPRPAPLVAVPYPPGSRARHRLGPRWPVHHDRQLGNQQAHPARHAAPEHDGGRLDRHRLPHRRGDRGAGVREAVRHARAPETIRVDSGGLPGRHRPDRPYPQGHQLDRLPLRDAGHRRHGHRRRVLGDQLGD